MNREKPDINLEPSTRDELIYKFEAHNKLGRGAEIGAFRGGFSRDILDVWTGELFLIDIWDQVSIKEYADKSNQSADQTILKCVESINKDSNRCAMIRYSSRQSACFFPDESLDFVFIDANHKYDYVKEDIETWYPKVRKGGLFCGHDYITGSFLDWFADGKFCPNGIDKYLYSTTPVHAYMGEFGVNPAVNQFCYENNYKLNCTKEWLGSWWVTKK